MVLEKLGLQDLIEQATDQACDQACDQLCDIDWSPHDHQEVDTSPSSGREYNSIIEDI